MMREYNNDLQKGRTIHKSTGSVGINPFEIKQSLMRGSGNVLGAIPTTDPVSSVYQNTYRGLMASYQTKPVVFGSALSCSTGVVVPDPLMMTQMTNKQLEYKKDLKKVNS